MKTLKEVNNNIVRNVRYSVRFFSYTDYDLVIEKPSMMEGDDWISFLNQTDTLELPLKSVPVFTKTQKLWFRNSKQFDKMNVELDISRENNIIEFIAKKTKYKNITLDDLKKLGCIVDINFIDNNGFQQSKRLYVGRPSVETYTTDKLILTISQQNKLLTNSIFEKNVTQDPTSSFYNYISLKQAFSNIYNIPHNVIDNKSYPITPFRLDESTYVETSSQDIVVVDGNIPNKDIYAEDTVGNTNDYIHTQFYYDNSEPYCGYKLTTYDENGDVLSEEDESVLNWDIWGNSQDAYDKMNDWYGRDIIFNYQRFFRPFKIVIAGTEDLEASGRNNYRIRKDFQYKPDPEDISNERRNDFYEPQVETIFWRQEEIYGGEHFAREGDRLVYFEVCGDVRPFGSRSACVLYDHHSNIYIYNMDRKIVYWNHIASLVESVPLPKQWLKMRDYIRTDALYYASRLNYNSNSPEGFISYIKPFCAVDDENGSHGERLYVSSKHSFKQNQGLYAKGGNYVGEKTFACLDFGNQDLDNVDDIEVVEAKLDYITQNWKPKTVRLNEDCSRITFVRSVYNGFDSWWDDWYPRTVKTTDYEKVIDWPLYKNFDSKLIWIRDPAPATSAYIFNEEEFDFRATYNYDNNSERQIITEVCDRLTTNAMLLTQFPSYDDTGFLDNQTYSKQGGTNSLVPSLEYALLNAKGSVNYYLGGNDFYWCDDNRIFKNLENHIYYDDITWKVLDYNYDINRAIIQTPTNLYYYDTLNEEILFDKEIFGFEWLLPMDRNRFLFTNPLINQSGEIIKIGSVTNEPVRLLSFSGNRYLAGDRLASSFIKNSFYDGDGVLNIGAKPKKFEITDYDVISNSIKKYKYDVIEITSSNIEKNGFTQTDNDDADNKEEDENEYDEAISITMWANKDVQIDITVTRTASDTITWKATNEFGDETGTKTITGFNFFTLELTGVFSGLVISCDFFNTELAQGEKFRGTIERRKLSENIVPSEIIDTNDDFPFLEDNILDLRFPFLYTKSSPNFITEMNNYFVNDNSEIREFIEFTIEVPTLLYFDTDYEPFSVGSIITLQSDSKYVNGYSLDDGVISSYNENKNDYYIESLTYNIKKGTTRLNLVSV